MSYTVLNTCKDWKCIIGIILLLNVSRYHNNVATDECPILLCYSDLNKGVTVCVEVRIRDNKLGKNVSDFNFPVIASPLHMRYLYIILLQPLPSLQFHTGCKLPIFAGHIGMH